TLSPRWWRSISWVGRQRACRLGSALARAFAVARGVGDRLAREHAQAALGVVAMDLERVERLQEGEGLRVQHLARNEEREARRIWGDERRRDQLFSGAEARARLG